MVALFLRGGKFLHDAFFSDVEIFLIDNSFLIFFCHGSEGIFLLIDNFIEDHLQILVGGVSLFLDILYLFSNAVHVVIFLPGAHKFSLESIFELFLLEQKFAVVEIVLAHTCIDHPVLIFFPHGILVVFLDEDLTFPFELLKVCEK